MIGHLIITISTSMEVKQKMYLVPLLNFYGNPLVAHLKDLEQHIFHTCKETRGWHGTLIAFNNWIKESLKNQFLYSEVSANKSE